MHSQDVIPHHLFLEEPRKQHGLYIWNAYPEVNEAFIFMLENSYAQVDTTSPFFLLLERFTVLLYDKLVSLNLLMNHG